MDKWRSYGRSWRSARKMDKCARLRYGTRTALRSTCLQGSRSYVGRKLQSSSQQGCGSEQGADGGLAPHTLGQLRGVLLTPLLDATPPVLHSSFHGPLGPAVTERGLVVIERKAWLEAALGLKLELELVI